MKTITKIIIMSAILIIGFLTIPFYATNMYCDIFDDTNGACLRISGIGVIDYTVLPYFIIDSRDTGNPNECWYQDNVGKISPCVMGGGPVDLDSDLSPSYALDFMGGMFHYTILPLSGLFVGVSALFLVPYFILKRKKIPSRPYMALILSGLLLHFSITEIIRNVTHLSPMLFTVDNDELPYIVPLYISFLIPLIVLVIAGILLYRSSVLRKLIKR